MSCLYSVQPWAPRILNSINTVNFMGMRLALSHGPPPKEPEFALMLCCLCLKILTIFG